jgi:hypothetical protein
MIAGSVVLESLTVRFRIVGELASYTTHLTNVGSVAVPNEIAVSQTEVSINARGFLLAIAALHFGDHSDERLTSSSMT